jgi:DnaK suppressor protein
MNRVLPQIQAVTGIERRSLVKAPATPTAKNRKPAAAAAGKGRPASVAKSAAAKPAPAKKPAAKAPVKGAGKPVAKKAPVKPAAKVSKPAAKAATRPAAKPAVAPKKVAPKAAVPAAPAKPKVAPVAATTVKTAPASKGASSKGVSAKATVVIAQPPVPVPVTIEPTPRPMGKRAAKKMMMEQMTQAAVVPTHAPNAAKATFSISNERVMTSPAPTAIKKDPKRANNWKSVPVDQLTDQDIQAMPDAEYMNDVQLAFFRHKLMRLKDDMLANAGETTEHLREDTVVVPDPADRATIEEEHALELRTRDRERKLLKKIEQAISRIDSGDYGYCEETGEPIGVGRLMARPTASLSLEAQQRRELKQKMFGD